MDIDPEEKWIAIGCKDGTVKIYDNTTPQL